MPYDLEKYRDKREKVMGAKKRGIDFGTWAIIISLTILLGLSAVVVPRSATYFNTRNLDDAIYKRLEDKNWPREFTGEIERLEGVKQVVTDTAGTRLVVTLDRTKTDTSTISGFIRDKGFGAVMLNRVSHHQRRTTLKEEAEFEAL